jgi:hypothetical protein
MGSFARRDQDPPPLQGLRDGRPDLLVWMAGSGHLPIIDDRRAIVHMTRGSPWPKGVTLDSGDWPPHSEWPGSRLRPRT